MIAATAQKLNLVPNGWLTPPAERAKAPVAATRIVADGFDAPVAAQQTLISGLADFTNVVVRARTQQSVENFFRGIVPARPVSAPMNPERFQNIDAAPSYGVDASYRAYNINGELMVKVTPNAQDAAPAWYDLGKVPTVDEMSNMPAQHNCWDPSTWGVKA